MKSSGFFSSYLYLALVATLLLGLAAPRQVQAAAALVSVTNTAANPVPTKAADNPALNSFGTRLYPNVRDYASFIVPAGKYLVIDSVSGFITGSNTALDVTLFATTAGTGVARIIPFRVGGPIQYLENANVRLVADPGSTVIVFVTDSNYNDSGGVNIDIYGYYVNAN